MSEEWQYEDVYISKIEGKTLVCSEGGVEYKHYCYNLKITLRKSNSDDKIIEWGVGASFESKRAQILHLYPNATVDTYDFEKGYNRNDVINFTMGKFSQAGTNVIKCV